LIDYWAERHGQPVGWVELKHRDYRGTEMYHTELLNARKWLSLVLMGTMTPWPSMFVSGVHHRDSGRRIVRYIPAMDIDARGSEWRVIQPKGGIVKSRNDREPCILVRHEAMKVLYDSEAI
jgi:hypothetical protein